ncbi:MAG: calcium-translocating P-type ATPase, PMCA-type [Patescibacteria group bacterium]|nr:calcium-translocating P-type ATPase, PMCA-type [Patescibacteria group bacterium]
MKQENWNNMSVKEVLHNLKSSHDGLSFDKAERRLKKYGKNILPTKKKFTAITIFLNQFKSPLVYILLVAALVSFILGEMVDASVILFAVFLNTIVGFVQELKAENSLAKLKEMIQHKSDVIRDGIEKEIDSENIVIGDIVVLRAGDRIPADGRIIEAHEFDVDESSLTGESVPVSKISDVQDKQGFGKSKDNLAYMGTVISRGRGMMIVTSTGIETKFGQIAQLLKETEEEDTPLQKQLASFSKTFGILTFLIVVIILLIGLFRGIPFEEIFIIAIAVAVAAIPEGLLVAVTVVLAIGMQRILKKGSLVRKLVAAETLGSTTIICTDKTGTLTEGKMQVDHIITRCSIYSSTKNEKCGIDHMKVISIGMICNNAKIENPDDELKDWRIHGDYTERALLQSGLNAGFNFQDINRDHKRLGEIPFTSERKFMATLNQDKSGDYKIYVKGAPEEIINRSKYVLIDGKKRKMTEDDLRNLKKKQNELSKKGLRIISVAYRDLNKDVSSKFKEENDDELVNNLVFVGLIAIKDPIRLEAKKTIELAREAGVGIVMITGDNRITAKTIGNELGMRVEDNNILDGHQLDQMSTKELNSIVDKIKVYARVSPHHKLRIVDALQSRGEVVAMTGDGVNDAPALKSSDIGIALGSGTEVAKGTADIILLDNNLKTIITAVEQGRVIYENIRKVIVYLVSDSFSEVIVIMGAIIFLPKEISLPLTAVQILWINLVTDGLPDAALTLEPKEENIMKEPPRKTNEPLLNIEIKTLIISISILSGLLSLAVFWYVFSVTGDFARANTITFSILAIDSLVYVFSVRSLRHSIFQKNVFSNKYLIGAVIAAFIFQMFAIYHPFFQNILKTVSLDIYDWSLMIFIFVTEIVIIEIIKYLFLSQKKV